MAAFAASRPASTLFLGMGNAATLIFAKPGSVLDQNNVQIQSFGMFSVTPEGPRGALIGDILRR
ncbi:hypothetical protein DXM27_05855 [Rhizobium rhizogenes]|uniref:Uncharacterized protein n=1 Tax=Rhizobium rhizogenes TaxID=359 RepID=A0AA88F0J4_RHIRH|nr:hypothetical protein DXM27_05855 [Rhizobium rhizogenes]